MPYAPQEDLVELWGRLAKATRDGSLRWASYEQGTTRRVALERPCSKNSGEWSAYFFFRASAVRRHGWVVEVQLRGDSVISTESPGSLNLPDADELIAAIKDQISEEKVKTGQALEVLRRNRIGG